MAPRAAGPRAPGTAYPARRCLGRRAARDPGPTRSRAARRGRSPRRAGLPPRLRRPPGLRLEAGRRVLASSFRRRALAEPRSLTSRPARSPSPPQPGLPHYPGGDRGQRLSSGGQRCGARAPGPPSGKASAQGPLAAQAAEPGGRRNPSGAVGLEFCPNPQQPSCTGLAPPWPQGRGPAPAPAPGLAARGVAFRVRGRGREETTIPSRTCAGAVQAAGRMGFLFSSPNVWGLSLTWSSCKTEVAE